MFWREEAIDIQKYKTITISLPKSLVDYLDRRINEINTDTLEETNRSKYIRLLIRQDMQKLQQNTVSQKEACSHSTGLAGDDMEFYDSLLQLGGYKR